MNILQTVPLLVVDDIEASRRFYCDGLGFAMTQSFSPDCTLEWCWLQHGGAAMMLQLSCDEDPPAVERGRGVGFYFLCDDADAVCRLFAANGVDAVPPETTAYGMRQTTVTDPDGYELCFESPAQPSG